MNIYEKVFSLKTGWILGRIENHTAKPLNEADIEVVAEMLNHFPIVQADNAAKDKRIAELEVALAEEGFKVLDQQSQIAALTAENEKLRVQYNELIMAVARKYPNETRHETVLRCIMNR